MKLALLKNPRFSLKFPLEFQLLSLYLLEISIDILNKGVSRIFISLKLQKIHLSNQRLFLKKNKNMVSNLPEIGMPNNIHNSWFWIHIAQRRHGRRQENRTLRPVTHAPAV